MSFVIKKSDYTYVDRRTVLYSFEKVARFCFFVDTFPTFKSIVSCHQHNCLQIIYIQSITFQEQVELMLVKLGQFLTSVAFIAYSQLMGLYLASITDFQIPCSVSIGKSFCSIHLYKMTISFTQDGMRVDSCFKQRLPIVLNHFIILGFTFNGRRFINY